MKTIFNIGLRAALLGARFLFLIIAAKYLTGYDMGRYVIFSATVSYMMFASGLEFYRYSHREVLKGIDVSCVFVSQISLYVVSLLLSISIIVLVKGIDFDIFYFSIILITEHLIQESSRLKIVLGKYIQSNFLLFLRGVSWSVICATLMLMNAKVTFEDVIKVWAVCNFLSLIVTITFLREINWWFGVKNILDKDWFLRGAKVSALMFLATMATRSTYLFDRYLIEYYSGLEVVAIYAIYMGIANSLVSFIDTGVLEVYYPRLIKAIQDSDYNKLLSCVSVILKKLVIVALVLSLGCFLFLDFIFLFIDKAEYLEYKTGFWVLWLALCLQSIVVLLNTIVYAREKDKENLIIDISRLVIFLLASLFFSSASQNGLLSIVLGLLISVIFSLFLRLHTVFLIYIDIKRNSQ
ncbi:hypothetical protein FXE51_01490 [Vibrio mimicus]|uniref:lipopolysaccharide biosynthesis protein n=1 Tax=Vibrio mimicus TaxID=674 RepID=UPI0011D52208|nr:hypothetical protein [Vibrio mimicus]TXZ77084.1 hypothetical protein FXE51_01490 [Vibrio mimicus]BCN22680.1 putative O-antigen flippase [Vibrio mimicus]